MLSYQGSVLSTWTVLLLFESAFIFYHTVSCLSTTFLIFLFCLSEHFAHFRQRWQYITCPTFCQELFSNFFIFFKIWNFEKSNGERGIWTLAPVARPTPLAGAPLQPLEYFSSSENSLPRYWFFTTHNDNFSSVHGLVYQKKIILSIPFFYFP